MPWVKVAGQFGGLFTRPRLMPQDHAIQFGFLAEHSADAHGVLTHAGIVVSGDPDEFRGVGEGDKGLCRPIFQPCVAVRVVKRIAKAIDTPRSGAGHQPGKACQSVPAVPRRQHLAASRKMTGFFKVEIGHYQCLLRRPEQRPPIHQRQCAPSEVKAG